MQFKKIISILIFVVAFVCSSTARPFGDEVPEQVRQFFKQTLFDPLEARAQEVKGALSHVVNITKQHLQTEDNAGDNKSTQMSLSDDSTLIVPEINENEQKTTELPAEPTSADLITFENKQTTFSTENPKPEDYLDEDSIIIM